MSAVLTRRLERLSDELTGADAVYVAEAATTIEKLLGEIARLKLTATFYQRKSREVQNGSET